MIGILVFGLVYLFGVYAFYKHAWDSAVRVDQYGNPITAKIISFPRNGEALRFHHFQVQDSSGSKLSVRADYNPSRGGQ
ncbi:dolichyl-phosphate-mannose--protein O-mannosyl transferase [Rhizobium ruizarguesonis]